MASAGDARHQLHGVAQFDRTRTTQTPAIFVGGVNNNCQINIPPFETLFDCIIGAYFILGFFYIFFGYRFFSTTMFITGFSFALNIVYPICTSGNQFPEFGNRLLSALAGIVFGYLSMAIQYVGLFVCGLNSGVLKGALVLAVYSNINVTDDPTAYWISLFVCLFSGILTACLNVYCKKGLTIISTSIYGGALMAMAVDHFLEHWAMVKWIYNRVMLEPSKEPPCLMSWIILGVWPFASLVGILVQTFYTGKGIHHEKGLAILQRRSKAVPLTREQKADLRQRKYRYLYQVKTAHGDVISQSYVRALLKKNTSEPWSSHGGNCSTLKSDFTHLTVLATEQDVQQEYSDTDEIHESEPVTERLAFFITISVARWAKVRLRRRSLRVLFPPRDK